MMLAVRDLEVAYGNITALRGITLEVEKGEIVTLIGANGAGKTTTLRTISGLLKPRKGEVVYKDKNITGANPAGSDTAITNHTFPVVDKQHFSPNVASMPTVGGTAILGRQLLA